MLYTKQYISLLTIKIDLSSKEWRQTLKQCVKTHCQSFTPDSSTLLLNSTGGNVCRGELEHNIFSLPLIPSHTFLFSSVVSPTSWSPSGKNSGPVWALHRLQFLREASICSRMESLHAPASPWSPSQAAGNASSRTRALSLLLWLWCSHCSFSLFSLPPPPPVQHFFLIHVFPKKQENCLVVGPIEPMGTGIHFPLPTVPLLQKTFATHTQCSGNSVYPSTDAETGQDAGFPFCTRVMGLTFRLSSCRNHPCPPGLANLSLTTLLRVEITGRICNS